MDSCKHVCPSSQTRSSQHRVELSLGCSRSWWWASCWHTWPSSPSWRWRTELGKWCVIFCPLCWRGCRISWPLCRGRPFCAGSAVWPAHWRWRSWRWWLGPGPLPRWWRRSSRRCWRCCSSFWSDSQILSSEKRRGHNAEVVMVGGNKLNNTSIWTHEEEIEATPRDTTHTRTKQKPNHIFNPGHVSLKRFLKRKVEKKKMLTNYIKITQLTYSINQCFTKSASEHFIPSILLISINNNTSLDSRIRQDNSN